MITLGHLVDLAAGLFAGVAAALVAGVAAGIAAGVSAYMVERWLLARLDRKYRTGP